MRRDPARRALTFLLLTLLAPGAALAQDAEPTPPPQPEKRPGLRAVVDGDVRQTEPTGDLAAAGETVTVSAPVADNAFLAGSRIRVEAEVAGDLFVFGEEIRVLGGVRGDVYAFGRSLEIGGKCGVEGHVYFAGESLKLEGQAGWLHVAAPKIRIAGQVAHDAELETVELELSGTIAGDLSYRSPRELSLEPGKVGGKVSYRKPARRPRKHYDDGLEAASFIGLLVLSLIGQLLMGAVMFFACPSLVKAPAERIRAQPGRALGMGFIVSLTLMALMVPALVLSGCGLGLGLVMNFLGSGALWFAVYFLSSFATAACLGRWVATRALGRQPSEGFALLALGLALFHLVGLIPFVGVLVHMGAAFAGIGGAFLALRAAGPVEKGLA